MERTATHHRRGQPTRLLPWNRSDLLALTVLLGIWSICITRRVMTHTTNLGNPPAIDTARVGSVREKIDPNTASVASLRRLPLIGPSKAEAIIAYRKTHGNANSSAFTSVKDLENVPGIGPGIVKRAKRYISVEQVR